MKGVKVYLIVVTTLLLIALGFGVYVWFKIQTLGTAGSGIGETGSASENIDAVINNASPEPGSIVIEKEELTGTQQQALETFGIEADSLTITPTMIDCAEKSLGKARVDQIIGGAAPNPLESLKLLGCIE